MFHLTFPILTIILFTVQAIKNSPPNCQNTEFLMQAHPTIRLNLLKNGFHRILHYSIDFENYCKECDFTLEQPFPSSIYVDTDELYELVHRKQANLTFPSFIDIEKPTEKSEPFSILLHSSVSEQEFTIPIHYRYHAPQMDQKYVEVNIARPTLFVNCPQLKMTGKARCFYEATTAVVDKCNWLKIPSREIRMGSLLVQIPVGDKSLAAAVSLVTVAVSWLACFLILIAIRRKMRKLNRKLD